MLVLRSALYLFVVLSRFATAGPVIAISVSYRLNIFGCLALEELSATDERGTSGN